MLKEIGKNAVMAAKHLKTVDTETKNQILDHMASELVKDVDEIIDANKELTHVFAVYCETTSGILNPINDIASLVAKKNLSLFIDAMSAFGALPLSSKNVVFDAVVYPSFLFPSMCIEVICHDFVLVIPCI